MFKYSTTVLLFLIAGLRMHAQQDDLLKLQPYLKKAVNWQSPSLHKNIPLNVYYNGDTTEDAAGAEVIVYLKNKAWERIGQEADLSILQDYIQQKRIVITMDYGNDAKAVSPFFDEDLHTIFTAVYGFKTQSLLADIHLLPKEFRCFFLPEGYRVATNLAYWEIDNHAVYGTMEFIMQSYNEDIVSKYPGLKHVSTPAEMVDKKGKPFDYSIKMDIVYPSQPKKKLPVIFYSDYFSARNPNSSPENYLPHFAGFTTKGYVFVDVGHCYNPCVTHFFHFIKFTLDHENGYACYTAAIRYLRAHAATYGMNPDYIGGAGISKGEYAITRLSDPNHESRKEEIQKFSGFPAGSPEPQPWQGYSSRIQAGMQGMGMGLFEKQFITADYVPNIIVCGEHDRDVIAEAHRDFIKRSEELDANCIDLFMYGLAHEFPYGFDKVHGVDRYQLFHDFFDHYLKVEEKLPPVVLMVTPFDNKKDVSPSAVIDVQFAPIIDASTILKTNAIKVVSVKTNKAIAGSWKAGHGGTKFSFTPGHLWQRNSVYKIIITTRVKDKAGTRLAREKITQFETGK